MSVEWYYTTNKQQMGPVSWDELRELAESGILKPHDLVWNDGMEEWVKAVRQCGLFAESEGEVSTPKTKPPSRRRSRDEDEHDEEDREAKRQRRKREEDRAKAGVGMRVAATLAGVLGLFLCCGCGCGGIGLYSMGGLPFREPGPPQNYVITNLRVTPIGGDPRAGDIRTFTIQQGRRVTINVINNNLEFPNTDVDLYVYQGNSNVPLTGDVLTPNFNRNCRADFVAPQTGTYRVRVVNIGPGVARVCNVNFEMN